MKKQFLIQDNKTLEQRSVGKVKVIALSLVFISLIVVSFYTGRGTSTQEVVVTSDAHLQKREVFRSKHDYIPNDKELDSVFSQYEKRAEAWLSREVFKGSPIKASMLALAARNAYDSTGVFVPVELALAQAQWESGMGREGRSPDTNPFNIGEYDNGTVKWFKSTFEGVQAYYYQVSRTYLRCRTLDELFTSYVDCSGHRYASTETYEETISNEYYHIKRWIDKSIGL